MFSLGWVPETLKYDKGSDGEEKVIPQIYIPKTGGQICESIVKLAEEVPEVEALVGVGVYKHRKGAIKGFLDSLVVEDCAEAGALGFTNTLRLKHRKPFVNLPSTRVVYGEEVRSCVIAKEGKKFVCSDLSSMENLWSFNYQIAHDKEYVLSQQSNDYDAHLNLCLKGGMLSQAEVDFFKICEKGFPKEQYELSQELLDLLNLSEEDKKLKLKLISKKRGIGKNCGYALQYSCGVKTLARTGGITEKEAKVILKAYKKMNWSIEAVVKEQKRKTVSHGTYQLNPYNGIWYFLKTEKDSYSTLVQGSGSYLLDLWVKQIDLLKKSNRYNIKGSLNLVATVHDENLQEFDDLDGNEELIKEMFNEALDNVNNHLGVEIKFGCDTQFGYKYSEIH